MLAFGEAAGYRAELQTQVPELLRETADDIFVCGFGAGVRVQEEQVDVGVRKEPAAAVASGGDEGEVFWGVFVFRAGVRGRVFRGDDDLVPQRLDDGIDECGAVSDGAAAIGGAGKFLFDCSRSPVRRGLATRG